MASKYICKICGTEKLGPTKTGICNNCKVEIQRKEKIEKWLSTGESGMTPNTTIRGVIRDHIYKEQN